MLGQRQRAAGVRAGEQPGQAHRAHRRSAHLPADRVAVERELDREAHGAAVRRADQRAA